MTITAQKSQSAQVTPEEERGSGGISPSQMHDAGYRDALNHRTNYSLKRQNSDYASGHLAGYRARPDSLFNLDLPTQAPLERGWGDERLNAI